jgi:hypothetical protein
MEILLLLNPLLLNDMIKITVMEITNKLNIPKYNFTWDPLMQLIDNPTLTGFGMCGNTMPAHPTHPPTYILKGSGVTATLRAQSFKL